MIRWLGYTGLFALVFSALGAGSGPAVCDAGPQAGVVLTGIEPDGPADQAGLRPGDRIERFDGHPVEGAEGLCQLLKASRPGESVKIDYRRAAELRHATVTAEARYQPLSTNPPNLINSGKMDPQVARDNGQARVTVDGQVVVFVSLTPSSRAEVHLDAQRVSVRERPAVSGYPREAAYELTGPVSGKIEPDVSVSTKTAARVLWNERSSDLVLRLGQGEQKTPVMSRWKGWGLICWDYDAELFWEHPTNWQLQDCWGFAAPGVAGTVPRKTSPPEERETLFAGGARITGLAPQYSAEQAGLRPGDLIIAVNGKPITHPAALQKAMEESRPNQRFHLVFVRAAIRRETDLTVDPAVIPPPQRFLPPTPPPQLEGERTKRLFIHSTSEPRIVLVPFAQEAVTLTTPDVQREERPKGPNRPRRILIFRAPRGEIRTAAGIAIRSDSPLTMIWHEGGPALFLELGEAKQ